MILGIGVDLVPVARMKRVLRSRWADRFVSRVFLPEEIVHCKSAPDPAQSYAARFAAKEAMAKALGTGFTRGVGPGNILVAGSEASRPEIILTGRVSELAKDMQIRSIHVSLSHTQETAAAFVVVETV
ncbi:holo-ACP synthase [Desulfomonile tiedjei]|uniref:Holo-[acyl-carrier-protein] synthase n=1 Tax=Desulfomonile tiedjei (strain ATCC 49306 / DSM 6799 / DCB-1) TaxID=706587 RepID=I4BZU9_DESTA|nr:holo-ACP synthase [Desulfomonile tiedjei]AFM22840.1 holo-(acyl-carrier-protein) synthase [Desulfomonile tiedjei DSM 6799]